MCERLQNVEKNLQAIEETEWLKEYLEHFPDANREAQRGLPFWPHEQDRNGLEDSAPEVEVRTEDRSSTAEVGLIMATMPDPKARGYFGPRRSRPATIPGTRALRRRAISTSPVTVGAGTSAGRSVVYCDVIERNRVAMSRHRYNVASRHYDGSRRCCYSGVN
jgi:hypothetical protein